jgi:TIR domain
MRIFISHISEESAIANCLKEWIESTLLGECEVFVSSDSAALPGGVKWLDKIDEALEAVDMMLVICSESSISRPWVNFETGCAWSRKIPVVPLCHSGMDKGSLPRPISDFQGINILDQKFPELLFNSLREHLSIKKIPRINFQEMQSEIISSVSNIIASPKQKVVSKSNLSAEGVSEEAINILLYMSKKQTNVSSRTVASDNQISDQKAIYYLEELEDLEFISSNLNVMTGASYFIDSKGRKFLFERGEL